MVNPKLTFDPIPMVDSVPIVNCIYIVDPIPPTPHAICHSLRLRFIEPLPLVTELIALKITFFLHTYYFPSIGAPPTDVYAQVEKHSTSTKGWPSSGWIQMSTRANLGLYFVIIAPLPN